MSAIEIPKEDIVKALDNKNIKIECPMCKNHEMMINGQLSALVFTDGDGGFTFEVGNRNIQTIQVICNKCGHIELFDVDYLLTSD